MNNLLEKLNNDLLVGRAERGGFKVTTEERTYGYTPAYSIVMNDGRGLKLLDIKTGDHTQEYYNKKLVTIGAALEVTLVGFHREYIICTEDEFLEWLGTNHVFYRGQFSPLDVCHRCGAVVKHMASHALRQHNMSAPEYFDKYILIKSDQNYKVCGEISCGKKVPLISLARGYREFCNKSCHASYKNKLKNKHSHTTETLAF